MNFKMLKKLNNGVEIPMLGLGVWQSRDGEETANAVKWAIEAGYRHIDTAAIYGNEPSVAKGLKESGIARKDVFITTKVWNDDQRRHTQREAFEKSLSLLKTDYMDLYLIHWPVEGVYKETWKVMEKLYEEKLVRAIGVSNFQPRHLQDLVAGAAIAPAINQVEINPRLTQKPLIQTCEKLGIAVESWSPLGGTGGNLLKEPALAEIGKRYGKSPAQVIIRWNLQQGIVVIPKSVHKERIAANIDVFDFTLPSEDMAAIDGLNRDQRSGPDPDNFSF